MFCDRPSFLGEIKSDVNNISAVPMTPDHFKGKEE